ncbi:hypothetical protein [Epilithonimonas xixisoli]|uniref:DUF4783 domain-containing protein n=1 Tax=Epilithonimonas xixisoli TaxID=1476462 RepID=A0A4R8IC09_9FLAO|nr:hypothetical protein [Epilithonimonas xixisoli]TDX87254.1 hypothetical protein B0I22_1442 [Epilithonimonas xixisoli]
MRKLFSILISSCLFISACAQKKEEKKIINQKHKTMNLDKITNNNVRKAIEALDSGDKIWYSYFTENPTMTDDENKIDFKSFFATALGKEKFLTIDKVENDGKDIYGNFKAGNWGTFRVFFKFHQNTDGKFDRLDIGQAH